jgi:hypothetical protein
MDFRRIGGAAAPDTHVVFDDRFYLEYLSADGTDTVYHLFALPEYTGPWAPPDGMNWMRASLEAFRVRAALPYEGSSAWCHAQWDSEPLPEIVHYAVRRVDDMVGDWLVSLDIGPERITGGALLKKMQEKMFPGRSFFAARMALLDRFRSQTVREVLAALGQPLPDGADIDEELKTPMAALFPLHPGMWYVRFRELQNRVTDHKLLAESFLGSLVRSA